MTSTFTKRLSESSTCRRLIALLCIMLVLFVGAAHLLHTHGGAEPANADCSLCAVAHLSALPATVVSIVAVAVFVLSARPPTPLSAAFRFVSFSLYVRPPPALTTHS